MFRTLLVRFWGDESGAVIAAEYLMLGSVVGVGSATGMVAVRDSVNDEYRELGGTIREVRQQYAVPMPKGRAHAAHPPAGAGRPAGPAAPVTFTCP